MNDVYRKITQHPERIRPVGAHGESRKSSPVHTPLDINREHGKGGANVLVLPAVQSGERSHDKIGSSAMLSNGDAA